MKTKLSSYWYIFIIVFFLGALSGWGITVYSYSMKYESGILCSDGKEPDKNGCCTGEVYTDMGDLGFNCCPEDGSDCFPPIK